ncbi:MAG: thiazole synthase [Candidatus Competibacteraceae bacterium]|nr:thiazole synthase [Candidatus Competibacteraceae bacterium]MBK8965009.1 thiazole synthase [Candidatus Competibacteraceae bacterium]MBK9950289.1 thiazole synthase [Candidatus Competibacteraceae bacterium]
MTVPAASPWEIGGRSLRSRLLLGTARYPSLAVLQQAIAAAGCETVTVSLRRESASERAGSRFWTTIKELGVQVLPNTAGCKTVKEALTTAEMGREIFETSWVKLEVIGDDYTLQPHPFLLVEAAEVLCRRGFQVFPYTTEDLVVAERLVQAGCSILMPWGAPIGSGQGLNNPYALRTLRARYPDLTLIVDAGIGKPSHAIAAMELGYDGVLVNTAVARATDPVQMGRAFGLAVESGRLAYLAGTMPVQEMAEPSTPVTGTPFWHQA